jgi:hypothetical protein
MAMHLYVGKILSNDAHIIYYQKRQCADMYKQLVTGMNAPVCGEKMLTNDAHIIYYQKR